MCLQVNLLIQEVVGTNHELQLNTGDSYYERNRANYANWHSNIKSNALVLFINQVSIFFLKTSYLALSGVHSVNPVFSLKKVVQVSGQFAECHQFKRGRLRFCLHF